MNTPTDLPSKTRPAVRVAVVMERTAAPNRWEDWQHRVTGVIADDGGFGATPRKLHDDGKRSQWLHPGFTLELYADECKGYFLNLTSGRPVWFVVWRTSEDDASIAAPSAVSVSYIEADRWLCAEEHVENVALQPELVEWLRVYTNEHYQLEAPRRQRAQSFLSPEERDREHQRLKGGRDA